MIAAHTIECNNPNTQASVVEILPLHTNYSKHTEQTIYNMTLNEENVDVTQTPDLKKMKKEEALIEGNYHITVQAAEIIVNAIINKSLKLEEQKRVTNKPARMLMDINTQYLPIILGRKGNTIKTIEEKYDVKVHIVKSQSDQPYTEVCVTSTTSARINEALDEIGQIIKDTKKTRPVCTNIKKGVCRKGYKCYFLS